MGSTGPSRMTGELHHNKEENKFRGCRKWALEFEYIFETFSGDREPSP